MSQHLTVIGNLATDPELRFTAGGKAKCKLVVITSKTKKNEQTGEWESTDQTIWNVTAWDRLAENCAESLQKGFPVIVSGVAVLRKYTRQDGSEGTSLDVSAFKVGLELSRFSARGNVVERGAAKAVADGDPWGGDSTPAPF